MSVLCCETIFSVHWFYIAHASSDKMRQHKMLAEGHHWLHILLPQNVVAADTYTILVWISMCRHWLTEIHFIADYLLKPLLLKEFVPGYFTDSHAIALFCVCIVYYIVYV